jgi:16S rRNA (cytosine967-C5)-methyltransferase
MPEPGSVDAVLVDAPCSGLGTLRRRPDRRWRASEAELPALAALGSKLLATAADLVKPGGFVVYSTCTVSRVENVDVLEGFLATESGSRFTIDSLAKETPDEWRGFLGPQGWLQSIPREDGPDGHFVARLKRAIG